MNNKPNIKRERVLAGLCIWCGVVPLQAPAVSCVGCRMRRNSEARVRQLRSAPLSPSQQAELIRFADEIGQEAEFTHLIALFKMRRDDPVRYKFFEAIWNERKWTIQAYGDEFNDLLADCVNYAKEIPDPIVELKSIRAPREVKTHDQSITALAMAECDGMTLDDFAAVSHLY